MFEHLIAQQRTRTPDVLECLANLSSDEVFTPPALANAMLDLLPPHVWSDPTLRWLDPSCKSGVFLREIARRLMAGLASSFATEKECRDHILRNMLFGIALTQLTADISRRTLYYSKRADGPQSAVQFNSPSGNILLPTSQHQWNSGSCGICGAPQEHFDRPGRESHAYAFIHTQEVFPNMKFDVIIGNPPYQIGDGGHGASATPIYQLFIQRAKQLNPRFLSMIVPARWYAGGKGLDNFRKEMIADRSISHLVDYPKLYDAFPGVKIRGGVCYFLRDDQHDGDCTVTTVVDGVVVGTPVARDLRAGGDVLVRDNRAVPILEKIRAAKLPVLDSASAQKPFGMRTNFSDYSTKKSAGRLKLYGNKFTGWVHPKHVTKNADWIPKYKVIVPMAGGGEGTFPDVGIAKPLVIGPNEVCTETYLVIDVCDTLPEAEALADYLRTRLVRFLISLRKPTQHLSSDKFLFVPRLPLTQSWTDADLAKHFGLTSDEVEYIASVITERP